MSPCRASPPKHAQHTCTLAPLFCLAATALRPAVSAGPAGCLQHDNSWLGPFTCVPTRAPSVRRSPPRPAAVTKTATIVPEFLDEEVYIMKPLAFSTQPVVKIATEPLNPSELPKMVGGSRWLGCCRGAGACLVSPCAADACAAASLPALHHPARSPFACPAPAHIHFHVLPCPPCHVLPLPCRWRACAR